MLIRKNGGHRKLADMVAGDAINQPTVIPDRADLASFWMLTHDKARGNRYEYTAVPTETTSEHSEQRISMWARTVRSSADEHAQTSRSEHSDRHSPRLAGDPDGVEAARQVARRGPAAICRQNPSSRGRGMEGPCLGAASLHSGHLRGIGPRNGNREEP